MPVIVPWRIRRAGERTLNFCYHLIGRVHRLVGRVLCDRRPEVAFSCSFHGVTGATVAIARTAQLLSRTYRVVFVCPPFSDYNRLLRGRVGTSGTEVESAVVRICDGNFNISDIHRWRSNGQVVIVSAHGVMDADNPMKKAHAATRLHVVSDVQLVHHALDPSRFFVIPNYTERVIKRRRTNNVGIVGRVADPLKNVAAAIQVARASNADMVHVWGASESARSDDGRVAFHPWTPNLVKVYNSFDVLVSMSVQESFGLVVIEALSAGIPCVLSDIPAFRKFSDCPGVRLVPDSNVALGGRLVDELMAQKDRLQFTLIEYWREHFSPESVGKMWNQRLDELLVASRFES